MKTLPLSSRVLSATAVLASLALLPGCGGDSDAAEGPDDATWAETTDPSPGATYEEARPGERGEARPGEAPSAPRDAAPSPVPAIPSGTILVFEVEEDVSTATHEAGQRVPLRLVSGVNGDHGAALPAGTGARAIVTEASRSGSAQEEAVLALRIASVQVNGRAQDLSGTIQSTEIEAGTRDSGQRSAAKVATGAAAGAVIGQILGRDTRSTVAGAAAGAAAGLGIALTTRDGHAVLPRGSTLTVRLDSPLVLP